MILHLICFFADKIDRTKTWNVEENDRLDPSYGPMTSLPQNSGPVIDHCRERTSSVTSEVSYFRCIYLEAPTPIGFD